MASISAPISARPASERPASPDRRVEVGQHGLQPAEDTGVAGLALVVELDARHDQPQRLEIGRAVILPRAAQGEDDAIPDDAGEPGIGEGNACGLAVGDERDARAGLGQRPARRRGEAGDELAEAPGRQPRILGIEACHDGRAG